MVTKKEPQKDIPKATLTSTVSKTVEAWSADHDLSSVRQTTWTNVNTP